MVCPFTITFENTETKEYVFYNINMNVTPADPYPVTELSGTVREVVVATITVTNPLKISVQIQSNQIICDNEYVFIKPNSFVVIPESVYLFIIFRKYLLKCHTDRLQPIPHWRI